MREAVIDPALIEDDVHSSAAWVPPACSKSTEGEARWT